MLKYSRPDLILSEGRMNSMACGSGSAPGGSTYRFTVGTLSPGCSVSPSSGTYDEGETITFTLTNASESSQLFRLTGTSGTIWYNNYQSPGTETTTGSMPGEDTEWTGEA